MPGGLGARLRLLSLGASLSSIREGRSQRIEGDHPTEVRPLVNDLNELLEDARPTPAATALTDLPSGLTDGIEPGLFEMPSAPLPPTP
jgi:hypothetical protein